jgi:hypothetical protein
MRCGKPMYWSSVPCYDCWGLLHQENIDLPMSLSTNLHLVLRCSKARYPSWEFDRRSAVKEIPDIHRTQRLNAEACTWSWASWIQPTPSYPSRVSSVIILWALYMLSRLRFVSFSWIPTAILHTFLVSLATYSSSLYYILESKYMIAVLEHHII